MQPISAADLAHILSDKTIRIGVQTDHPPYGYIDSNLEPQGLDIATASLIAQELDVKLKLFSLASPERISSLQKGKVDLVIATLGKSAEREALIDFSIAYAPLYAGLYAARSIPLSSFAELAGQRVAVTRDSIQDHKLTEIAPDATQIQRYDSDSLTMAAFLQGEADVAATSVAVASLAVGLNPQLDMEYKLLLSNVPCYIGVAKGNHALLHKVNTILRQAKADGSLNAISAKYLGRPVDNLPE
jgi:polar amino acid transport system substrate-binding protein